MSEKEKELIAEYTEFILMGFDKGMRISMEKTKNIIEKRKIESIYHQFMSAIITSMETFEEIKEQK